MKVLVYPRDRNPYQELLYAPLRNTMTIDYLEVSFAGPLRAALYVPRLIIRLALARLQGYQVLHIHWLYMLGVPAFVPGAKRIAYVQTCMFLRAARLLGYKLIWTAHNVLPHTPVTVNDVAVRKLLVRCCSRIIVPSTSTIADLAAHGITAVSCVVIPHGSYIGVYPNTVSVQQARRTLNIPAHARVIGFFGAIHPYKNIPELVRAFVELAARDAELYMVLAGKCSDARVDSMVAEANATCGNRLRLQAEYIPDSGVQLYLNAADVMVFPFSRVTTSGSILLASSFGKPVVAPRIGVLQDMPDTIGVLYDPTAKVALAAHIGQVLDDPATARHMGAASYKYAAALSWETIAAQTGQVYAGAVRGR